MPVALETVANPTAPPILSMYGKMLTFSRLQLHSNELAKIQATLSQLLTSETSQIPVIIDSSVEQDLPTLMDMLWQFGLQPIGVVAGVLEAQAKSLRLPVFPSEGKRLERLPMVSVTLSDSSSQPNSIGHNGTISTQNVVNEQHSLKGQSGHASHSSADAQKSTDIQPSGDATSSAPKTPTGTQPDPQDSAQKPVKISKKHQQATVTPLVENNPVVEKNHAPDKTSQLSEPAAVAASSVMDIYANLHTTQRPLIYTQMLRSGQSLNHIGGDIIITNSVNRGAEVVSDYSLHIYGRGQGRLMAGATGDTSARIFCQDFAPTLVSVAGTYCLLDNIPKEMINKPVQVRYEEGRGLVFELMTGLDTQPPPATSEAQKAAASITVKP